MSSDGFGALPVRVAADARLQAQLVPFVEGTLGWQVTHGDELPAAVALVDVGARPVVGAPSILLVRDDDPPVRAARAATAATAVVRWPAERDRLDAEATRLLHRAGRGRPAATTVRLGGAAGGVGTTTAALALGGLLAWHGRPTLVVASGDVPLPEVPGVDPSALSAHRTWDAAAEVAGVAGLRVLVAGPGPRAPAAVPDDAIVIRDDGVATDVDVLVCCRDRAGLEALDATAAGAAVVMGRGAVSPSAWTRGTQGHARQVHLDWSVRVGRAGVLRRVPASLPGRWLAGLVPLARLLVAESSTPPGSTVRGAGAPP